MTLTAPYAAPVPSANSTGRTPGRTAVSTQHPVSANAAPVAAPAERPAATKTSPPPALPPQPPKRKPFGAVGLIASAGGPVSVSICFPSPVDHAKATGIVQRMAEIGRWQIADLKIKDERFVSVMDETNGNARGQMQTYVYFNAAGVINARERWIWLAPFVLALKEYSPLRLAVAMEGGARLDGPGDYSDNKVQIECNRLENTVAYDITVKDRELAATGVPAHPPADLARAQGPPSHGRAAALTLLIGGLAMAATAVLALMLWWKGLWPGSAKNSGGKRHSPRAASKPQ
jgi:hypothetical protein